MEEDGKGKLGGRGVKRNSETYPKKQRDEESKGGRSEMRKIQQCTKGKREKKKGARGKRRKESGEQKKRYGIEENRKLWGNNCVS